jgi:hypothetical protein
MIRLRLCIVLWILRHISISEKRLIRRKYTQEYLYLRKFMISGDEMQALLNAKDGELVQVKDIKEAGKFLDWWTKLCWKAHHEPR